MTQIRKNKRPETDPWGTPASTVSHDDVWLFKTTIWNLLPKNFWLFLEAYHLVQCVLFYGEVQHVKSKALDISKSTPLVIRGWIKKMNRCHVQLKVAEKLKVENLTDIHTDVFYKGICIVNWIRSIQGFCLI